MTDAERVAKAWADLLGVNYANPAQVERFQRLIDAGVITVAPPPDPAEQIAEVYWQAEAPPQIKARFTSLIADGWIVPGPRCEGHEPPPDPLAQAVLDAAEAWGESWPGGRPLSENACCLLDAVRARQEAQS